MSPNLCQRIGQQGCKPVGAVPTQCRSLTSERSRKLNDISPSYPGRLHPAEPTATSEECLRPYRRLAEFRKSMCKLAVGFAGRPISFVVSVPKARPQQTRLRIVGFGSSVPRVREDRHLCGICAASSRLRLRLLTAICDSPRLVWVEPVTAWPYRYLFLSLSWRRSHQLLFVSCSHFCQPHFV